jgi:DNA-binding FadR family transcriptional regulator
VSTTKPRRKVARPVGGGLVEGTAQRLQKSLMDGRYEPGTSLPSIEELASSFGVSQPVVREALRILSEKGLVDVRHGDGTYAREPQASDLAEAMSLVVHWRAKDRPGYLLAVMEFREIVESAASRLAAERCTPADLDAVTAAYEACATAARAGDTATAHEFDIKFHAAIAQASHNPLLALMFEVTSPLFKDVRLVTAAMRKEYQRTRAHQRILEAILARNGEVAAEAGAEHVRQNNAEMQRYLLETRSQSGQRVGNNARPRSSSSRRPLTSV